MVLSLSVRRLAVAPNLWRNVSHFGFQGSSILAAVEECQAAGFNIVSMSLGGPFPNIL
jgi:hypothetical protein